MKGPQRCALCRDLDAASKSGNRSEEMVHDHVVVVGHVVDALKRRGRPDVKRAVCALHCNDVPQQPLLQRLLRKVEEVIPRPLPQNLDAGHALLRESFFQLCAQLGRIHLPVGITSDVNVKELVATAHLLARSRDTAPNVCGSFGKERIALRRRRVRRLLRPVDTLCRPSFAVEHA